MTAREPSAEDVVERQHSGMSSNGNTSPSAVEVIAEALAEHRPELGPQFKIDCVCGWKCDKRRPGHHIDHQSDTVLAALKAAGFVVATRDEIRAWSPIEQAELIGGEVTSQTRVLDIVDDHVTADGLALTGFRMSRHESVVGPWREVQP